MFVTLRQFTFPVVPRVALGCGLLILYLMLLFYAVTLGIVVIARLDLESGVRFSLHKREEQMALHWVEQILAVVGMTIGHPVYRHEIAHSLTRDALFAITADTVEVELCIGIHLGSVFVTRRPHFYLAYMHSMSSLTVLPHLGHLLFGLCINLADVFYLVCLSLGVQCHNDCK